MSRLTYRDMANLIHAAREPVSIVVARSQLVGGEMSLNLAHPPGLQIRAGTAVFVKHAYRVQEEANERQECRFTLATQIGGMGPPDAVAEIPRPLLGLDQNGCLQQKYLLMEPGNYMLTFTVGAQGVRHANRTDNFGELRSRTDHGFVALTVS